MGTFPDIEAALLTYLGDLGYAVTSTPADLKTRLPVLRIQRIGGPNDKTNDYPRVSVQAFTARSYQNPRAAQLLAEAVRDKMRALPAVVDGVRLDIAETESGPVSLPWPDVDVTVVQAIYRLTTRA